MLNMIDYDYDFNYDGIYGGYYDDNYSISATNNNNNILRIHNNNYYDNDIIYHDILPSDTPNNVESMVVRSIYHIQLYNIAHSRIQTDGECIFIFRLVCQVSFYLNFASNDDNYGDNRLL